MELDTDGPGPGTRGLSAALAEMRGLTEGFAEELGEAASAMRGMDSAAGRLARSLGSSLRSALDRAIFCGAKLGEVVKSLGADLLGRTVDIALKPVSQALSGGVAGLFSGLAGGLGSAIGFARGGVVESGRVRAFASGGVVDGPTLFPMRGGIGLAGEAGAEAILPLARGPDGRLGVRAGGGAPAAPVVNVTIQTPDIASFERSRGQIAAELARAVSRGSARL